MKLAINLDTQAVVTQPAPVRAKAGCFVPVEITFYRGSQPVRLTDGAVIEFALKPQDQVTGAPLVYFNAFNLTGLTTYTGAANFSGASLLAALGLGDDAPDNDQPELEASGEVTWSYGGHKFRSATFPVVIEPPLTEANASPTPDPLLYPTPQQLQAALDAKADKGILNPDDGKRYRITVTGNPPIIGVEEIL